MLVLALFNFQTNWFEPAPPIAGADNEIYADANDTSSFKDTLADGASAVASALNSTVETIANAAAAEADKRARARSSWLAVGMDWFKEVYAKGEVRINCMNTIIRL